MPTIRQLVKNPRVCLRPTSKSPALQQCPQKKGVTLRVYVRNPKKPNSAKRKVASARLLKSGKKGQTVICYIPGEGHTLQEHSLILIRGGRVKDLPGVRYRAQSGTLDFVANKKRKQKRSKYGVGLSR